MIEAMGLGDLALAFLPVAMIGYSAALASRVTESDRRLDAALGFANAGLIRSILASLARLVGAARVGQAEAEMGYVAATRTWMETSKGTQPGDEVDQWFLKAEVRVGEKVQPPA